MFEVYEELTSDDSKAARAYLRRIVGLVLCAIAVGCTVMWATAAHAETFTMRAQDGDWVRLSDDPCPVSSDWLALKKAEMFYQGKIYAACWTVVGGAVLILDEAGDVSTLPLHAFTKDIPI